MTFFELDLYDLVVHSDNWDHVFPCPNRKVTRPRRSDGPSFLPWMCIKISKRPGEEFKIFLAGKQLSQEMYFNYLGSLIEQDGSCEKEMAIVEVEL